MDLRTLFTKVLIDSGQFLTEPDDIELNQDMFAILVSSTLAFYNKYSPKDAKFNLSLSDRSFTFSSSTNDSQGNKTGIPSRIVSVIPVKVAGVYPSFWREYCGDSGSVPTIFAGGPSYGSSGNRFLTEKTPYPVEYRRPTLYVPVTGLYDVHAMYKHEIRTETVDGEKFYYLDTIEENEDHLFFDLLVGKFLVGLGRSRRAFTLNDLPVIADASDLVSDGKEIIEKSTESLTENASKWYLAWR